MSENRFDEVYKGRNKKYTRKKDFRHSKDDGDFDGSLRFKETKKRQNKKNWKKIAFSGTFEED